MLVFLALLALLGFPFIKLATIGAHERLRMRDVRWLYVSCAALVVVGTFAVLAADSYQRWKQLAITGWSSWPKIATSYEGDRRRQVGACQSTIARRHGSCPGPKCTPMDVVTDWFDNRLTRRRNSGLPERRASTSIRSAWVHPCGRQIWKITSDRSGTSRTSPSAPITAPCVTETCYEQRGTPGVLHRARPVGHRRQVLHLHLDALDADNAAVSASVGRRCRA